MALGRSEIITEAGTEIKEGGMSAKLSGLISCEERDKGWQQMKKQTNFLTQLMNNSVKEDTI